jgi:hypothetical protein
MVENSIDMRHIILLNTINNLVPDLAYKGSNRHACTNPSRKQRLASLEQSQKPLIDSLKNQADISLHHDCHFLQRLHSPICISLKNWIQSQVPTHISHGSVKGGILYFPLFSPFL